MKYFIALVAAGLFAACGTTEDHQIQQDSIVKKAETNSAISDVQAYRPDIENTPWDGDLRDAVYWKDNRGENVVLVSVRPQYFWEQENPKAKEFFPNGEDEETLSELTEIFVTHYLLKSGEAMWLKFNQHHDFLFGCCDVYMDYQPASLQVLDADSNGTGEYYVMYHETEGDGTIGHVFNGTLLLELDSVYYMIQDETGLGTELAREEAAVVNDQIVLNVPRAGVYSDRMMSKWTELYNAKVEQDRAEVTEQNNVNESGHADHQH